ncbi:transposable element Tc3 transposase [Trichonephila clavipes]|nr:transposable element Tc3 transposase [Trichonephila clavipes]
MERVRYPLAQQENIIERHRFVVAQDFSFGGLFWVPELTRKSKLEFIANKRTSLNDTVLLAQDFSFFFGGIILGSRTDPKVQIGIMIGQICRDVVMEQHVRLFRGAMRTEFVFMDDNTRPHRANFVSECLQSERITRMGWPAFSPDLNPVEHVWDMLGR